MNSLTETDRAYIAGIVDGEGSIMLTQLGKNQSHSPVIGVSSTDRELLEWLKTTTGTGHISYKRRTKPHHSDSWDWKVVYNPALELLEAIYPYLQIDRKKYRAELLHTEYKGLTPRNGKYTPEMLQAKNNFLQRFRDGRPRQDKFNAGE